MKSNIGCFESSLRIIIGAILIALTATGVIGVWGWIGFAPLLTGVIRFCPLYRLIGKSGCCNK
jgi:Protein of unknown function (DUF2892)